MVAINPRAEVKATDIGCWFDEGILTVAVRRNAGRVLDQIHQHTAVTEDACWALLLGLLREHAHDNPIIRLGGYGGIVLAANAHERTDTREREAAARIVPFSWDADGGKLRADKTPMYSCAGAERVHELQIALRGKGLIPAVGDESKLVADAFAFERALGGGAIHFEHPDIVTRTRQGPPTYALAAMLVLASPRPLVEPEGQSLANYDPFAATGHDPFSYAEKGA